MKIVQISIKRTAS